MGTHVCLWEKPGTEGEPVEQRRESQPSPEGPALMEVKHSGQGPGQISFPGCALLLLGLPVGCGAEGVTGDGVGRGFPHGWALCAECGCLPGERLQ